MIRTIRHGWMRLSDFVMLHSRRVGLIGMAVLFTAVGVFFGISLNVVSIRCGGRTQQLYTLKRDVAGILDDAGYDESYDLLTSQQDGNRMTIEVAPTFHVYVTYDDQTREIVTRGCTVREAIELAGFTYHEKDQCNFDVNTRLYGETYLDLVTYVEPEPEPAPAPVAPAAPAMSLVSNVSVSSNGGVISTLTPDQAIPLDANGLPIEYTSVTRVQATAYTYTGFRCSTGVYPQPGYIAVNPNVIPYGTKMYIVSCDGRYTYGYAVAADTGGFIKSRPTNVDLFMATEMACRNFGRRDIYIYFLP